MRRPYKNALLLAFLTSSVLCAQRIDTVFGQPVIRQYVNLRYNIGLVGIFIGTEVLCSAAPYNWMHVQCSYRAYEMAFSGVIEESGPHRAGWDLFVDVRAHVPFVNTFTGWSFGPYYNFGGGTLSYKERLGQYYEKYFDRFDFRRHIIGGTMSFVYCAGKRHKLMLELYFGAGKSVLLDLNRRAPEHPWLTDHTAMARDLTRYGVRGGFCIGYVFH